MNCPYADILDIYVSNDGSRTISFGKCCVLNDIETFGSISFDDFYALADPWEFIKFKYSILPVNHSFQPPKNTLCNETSICDWRDLPIGQIRVNINSCNLSCIMCHNDHSYDRESMEMYWYIMNLIKGHSLERIIPTTGGEPFLQKNKMIEYVTSLTKNDCHVMHLISNGTLLSPNDIRQMADSTKQNGIEFGITVSLDSTDCDTYCKIRNATSQQFNAAMQTIECLHKENILRGINLVMMPENEHTIYNDCAYWKNRGVFMHVLPVRYDGGCGAAKINTTIELIKKNFPEFYGDI